VLNTLREHGFQAPFKKEQTHWRWCIYTKEYYFEGDEGQSAKIYFLTRWKYKYRKLWMTLAEYSLSDISEDTIP
jgi:hypothetical protein